MTSLSVLFVFTGELENQAELEEKTTLINQVLELQHTLEGTDLCKVGLPEFRLYSLRGCRIITTYIHHV